MRILISYLLAIIAPLSGTAQQSPASSQPLVSTFTNPLLPAGADPAVVQRDGFYYYMQTTGRNLTIWKTRDLTNLKSAEKKVVWVPPPSGAYSKEVWAPELHFLQGKWYIYFAADSGTNEGHRMWVLENAAANPLEGTWEMKGKLSDTTDRWAIDPSVFQAGGKDYVIWSGWQGEKNIAQNIFIARLKNPWTIAEPRVMISAPQFSWEKVGDLDRGERGVIAVPHVDVNEGPEILQHGDKVFLIYSASGCWTNYYELGMLTATTNSNLLDPASWKKSPVSVFWESPEAGVFAPGHNTFFKSPDGKEDWILYHANSAAGLGCGDRRSPRAQKFNWKADGSPDFGRPRSTAEPLTKPSGTQ